MVHDRLPRAIPPMLAVSAEPFDADDHLFELKWDGIRCLAFIDGMTRLQSRNLKPLDDLYPALANLHEAVRHAPCVLDGEIVALRDGRPSFLNLQKRHQARRPEAIARLGRAIPVVYVVFDLLYYEGRPVMREPLRRRREMLTETLTDHHGALVAAEAVPGRGKDYFAAATGLGLEGVVGKQIESPYLPGRRSRYWVKFKKVKTASFVICGYTVNPTTRGEISALVLGAYTEGRLRNYGMVGTGFTRAELRLLGRELAKLQTEKCPFTGTSSPRKDLIWTEPRLVCDVQYLELTERGTLRHPLYKGLRGDLAPEECRFPPDEAGRG
ncbi:MAG: ATP-dependent DNA ligase [Firmicutes bacterium]|nr:ATP-dependent DNA ligase [Bacillota bacterium]